MINGTELDAVHARLKLVITTIALRHRSCGDVLTWNLLHAIEEEAFSQLEATGDLDKMYLRMLRSLPVMTYPRTDEVVDFGNSNAIPAAFFATIDAYRICH